MAETDTVSVEKETKIAEEPNDVALQNGHPKEQHQNITTENEGTSNGSETEETVDAESPRTLNTPLGKSFLSKQNPEVNPEELWKQEEALTLEDRRKRYTCEKFYIISDILTWHDHGPKLLHEPPSQEYHFKVNQDLNKKVALFHGDITTLELDAIVNAANSSLLGGAGVDGAIHGAAGDMLREECRALHGCSTGQTKITRGYNLPAKYVLHTVGPMDQNEEALESSYTTCLQLVTKHNIRSVAFCGISTGIYGFDRELASKIALRTIRNWIESDNNKDTIDLLIICTFTTEEKECYEKLMPIYFPIHQPQLHTKLEEPEVTESGTPGSIERQEIRQQQEQQPEIRNEEQPQVKQEPIVKREGVEEVVTEVDEEVVEDEERKLQEELKQREEEAKKQLEEQAERKRKKDLELKKQRDELEKRIKEEHDRRLKEDAIKKQKQTLQRQSQGKRIKPRENPKPITINISKAGMFTPEATPTTARASPPLGAAAAAPPKVTQIVNPGEKGVSKSEEGLPKWQLMALPVLLVSVFAFNYFRNKV